MMRLLFVRRWWDIYIYSLFALFEKIKSCYTQILPSQQLLTADETISMAFTQAFEY